MVEKENKNSKERDFGLQNLNEEGKKEVNSDTGSCSKMMPFRSCTHSLWALRCMGWSQGEPPKKFFGCV